MLSKALLATAAVLVSAAPAGAAIVGPACTPSALNTSAALAGGQVTVSPMPGSRIASAQEQISFLGVPASEIGNVRVVGSQSGPHSGRLLAYSQGDGGSFVPRTPFTPGETVQVSAVLRPSTPLAWSFGVAEIDTANRPGPLPPPPPPRSSYFQHFVSRPDLRPPAIAISTSSSHAAPGDMFLAPYAGPGQSGPMILDSTGRLVWFHPLSSGRATDFRVQRYEGKPVLTWWQDPLSFGGHGGSADVIANSSYQRIAVVRAGNGYRPDLHEFLLPGSDTALITIYAAIRCDLRTVNGPADGAVDDTLLQELDLHTGLVRFEWHTLDHVAMSDSYFRAGPTSLTSPFDYFHINAVDPLTDGTMLVNSRNTWAVYDVDRRTGAVRWTLGGKVSSFKMGSSAQPVWQHDARAQPDGTISFFDNGDSPALHSQSRGIVLSLNQAQHTATLVARFDHPTPLLDPSQGNMQALPGGDWMVGWGQLPNFSEFAPDGSLVFDATMPVSYQSYRTYKLPWSARPPSRPALVVRGATAYASWNGATGVASWRALTGSSANALTPLAPVASGGFETSLTLPARGRYVEVQALDGGGAVLATSAVVRG